MKTLLIGATAALIALSSEAQNCETVIALSKTTSSQVSDQESFEEQAANFCSDYSKSRQSGSSMDAGGSYGLFSASVGMSNQSAEAIASKYCSTSNNRAASKNAYKSYVESISPNAYSAYQRCLELSKKDLRFSVDAAAILPSEFTISASFTSTVLNKTNAKIEISASEGVSCISDGQPKGIVEIATGSTMSITCKRSAVTTQGYVRFVNRDSGVAETLTLPWQAYTPQGVPSTTLQGLQQQVARLEARAGNMGSTSGNVGLRAVGTRPITDTSACPTGSDAYRGEMKGKVTFPTAFAEPPAVSIGLVSIDTAIPSTTGLRLAVSIAEVSRTGFTYSFYTWCNTSIINANASWIAVSR